MKVWGHEQLKKEDLNGNFAELGSRIDTGLAAVQNDADEAAAIALLAAAAAADAAANAHGPTGAQGLQGRPGADGSLGEFSQGVTGSVVRTAISKLRETVSIKDFGALGDGATDDTAAIQAAINSVKPDFAVPNSTSFGSPGAIFFPAGNYLVTSSLKTFSGQRIFGVGPGSRLTAKSGVFPNDGKILIGSDEGLTPPTYYGVGRVDNLCFEADAGTGIWAIGMATDVIAINMTIENLLIKTPKGLALDTYAQQCVVRNVLFGGATDQMIHLKGNVNSFYCIDKEAGTGTTTDPYILIEDSEAATFRQIIIEGSTSANKTLFKASNTETILVEDLHCEPPGKSNTSGRAVDFDNVRNFQFLGVSFFGGANNDECEFHAVNGSYGTVAMGNAFSGNYELVYVADDSSHFHFETLSSQRTNNQHVLDQMHKRSSDRSVSTYLAQTPVTGVSAHSSVRNAASENLLVNPSFEAGTYGWFTNGDSVVTHSYALAPSEFGPGLMLDVTMNTGNNAIVQAVAVPAAWVGRNMTLTFCVKVAGGPAGVAYAAPFVYDGVIDFTVGQSMAAYEGTGGQLVTVNFRPQAAGTLQVGVVLQVGAAAGATHLYLDRFRLGFGTVGEAAGGVYQQIELAGRSHTVGSAAPTAGTWKQGDIVFNGAPAAAGSVGWVCVTAGSPGTWKTFGAISA